MNTIATLAGGARGPVFAVLALLPLGACASTPGRLAESAVV